MPTPDLPVELWLEILAYLPRSALHKMIGVNRLLFELALNDIYEEVRFISDDTDMRKIFKQLMQHPGIARRVRCLFLRPAFLPAVDDLDLEEKSKFRGTKSRLTGAIFDDATKAVHSCPNLEQVTLVLHDHALIPEFTDFLKKLWSRTSIRKVAIDTTVAKIPALLQPLTTLNALTEFDINISVTRFAATSAQRQSASKAVLKLMAAFSNTLTALTFSSLVPMELDYLFENSTRLLHLKNLELRIVFNIDMFPETEGLTQFVYRHSPTLETLLIRPTARQVSLSLPDSSYNIWINYEPPQKPRRAYSLAHIALPRLRTLDIGLREPSPTNSDGTEKRALPPIARFAPSLTKLDISDVKLTKTQLVLLLESAVKPDGSCSLEDLSFDCYNLTFAMFDTLAQGIPSLKRLEISYATLTSPSAFAFGSGMSENFLHEIQARRYPQWKLQRLRLSTRYSCGNTHPEPSIMSQVAHCFSQPIICESDQTCDECNFDRYYYTRY